MAWLWLGLAIGLMVVELSTVQLVSVWFAVSAAVVSIIKLVFSTLGFGWQVLIFVALSAALLAATRPLVKKYVMTKKESQKTNLELVLGKDAIVTEEINNIKGMGAIKVNGLVWSARSVDESIIPIDTIVVFKQISGNKAFVERKGE